MSAARKAIISAPPPLLALTDPHVSQDRLDITDEATFARLYTTYQPAIRNYLRKQTNGAIDVADDLAQDTFFKAWRGRAAFSVSLHRAVEPERLFRGWLFTIAQRLVIDHYRRDQVVAWVSLDMLSERTPHRTALVVADAAPTAPEDGDPDAWVADSAQMRAALARLSPRYQAVLALREQGYTVYEIAARVGCVRGGAKMLSSRATAAFHAAYAYEAREDHETDQTTREETHA